MSGRVELSPQERVEVADVIAVVSPNVPYTVVAKWVGAVVDAINRVRDSRERVAALVAEVREPRKVPALGDEHRDAVWRDASGRPCLWRWDDGNWYHRSVDAPKFGWRPLYADDEPADIWGPYTEVLS